jgi:hypothetical protein
MSSNDLRRAPADFLPEARARIAAHGDDTGFAPWEVARADQVRARSEELMQAVAPLVQEVGHQHLRLPPAAENAYVYAWYLALLAAGKRRTHTYCPHVDLATDLTMQNLVANVSAGFMARDDCPCYWVLLRKYEHLAHDGVCDMCEQPSTLFCENFTSVGGLKMGYNYCSACERWRVRHIERVAKPMAVGGPNRAARRARRKNR